MYSVGVKCEAEPVVSASKPDTYIALLLDLLPLFFVAFSILFLKGVSGLRSSFMRGSFLAQFANVVISSAIGSALAVGCALLLPLFDKNSDPTVMLGIVVFVAVAGVKVIDAILYKKLGVHFIDVSNNHSSDAEWMRMTQDERQACLRSWRETREESENE